jgi:hypothetical protein
MEQAQADELKANAKAEAAAEDRKRLTELKAAFPDEAEFVLEQHELGHTVLEAKAAYADILAARVKEQDETISAKDKELAEFKAKGPATGVEPLSEDAPGDKSAAFDGDPIEAWTKALQAKIAAGMDNKRAASALVREQPELHAAYLEAYNELHAAARGSGRR